VSQPVEMNWGSVRLAGPVDADTDYQVEVIADGTHLGNPEHLVEYIKNLAADGMIVGSEEWGGREVPLRLMFTAPRGIAGKALQQAEDAMFAEAQRKAKSPLSYLPPAEDAARTFVDVQAATLRRDTSDGWDFDEQTQEARFFSLDLMCLPFVRPENTVIVPALPVPPNPIEPKTWVDVDTCDSVSGWTRSGALNTSIAASGGKITAQAWTTTLPRSGPRWLNVRRAGTISMSGTPYLVVDVRAYEVVMGGPSGTNGTFPVSVECQIDGGARQTPVGSLPSPFGPAATRRLFFACSSASISDVRLMFDGTGNPNTERTVFEIYNVGRTNVVGDAAEPTPRQQVRLLDVTGVAPTQAAIRLYDATPSALGSEILVHTSTNTEWQPPLRRWLKSSAGVTADTARVSGGRHTLTSACEYEFPASMLTEGLYALTALLNVTTAGDLTWTARMVDASGNATVGSSITTTGTVAVGVTSGYEVVDLGALHLPVVPVEGDQLVELKLTGTANMTVDEAYLFGLHDGVLTHLSDTDSLTWVEIRSPELGATRPSVWGGLGSFGTNPSRVDWKVKAFGSHRFEPGPMQVTTVTTSSLASQSDLEYFERHHSHVPAAS